ncbi:hypothetical protein DNTS_006727 [Danionella cerebrum]|uniref:Uncharacterized protein n=1 Tax=Danionella cerebrum TaxID=2873325 RepID=A0A553NLD8_9TELE|nr:hypothetical protein DNTS_006727 [Danionella translucida]
MRPSPRNGLLVMLLFRLCHAQDDALPSPGPEPAPPSLGDVIDAVKAAFEQAVQISTTGAVREALEEVVEELTPQKSLVDQSVADKDEAKESNQEQGGQLTAGEPKSLEGLTQDIEASEVIEAQEESLIPEPLQKSVKKPVELVLEALDSVLESEESVLKDEGDEGITEEIDSDDSSPLQIDSDKHKENKSGDKSDLEVEEGAGNQGQGVTEKEPPFSEKIKEEALENEPVQMTEGNSDSELSQEERQTVTAQMGTDGGLVDTEEAEQEEDEQIAAKTEEGAIEVEAKRHELKAGSEAHHQRVSKEDDSLSTDKTVPEKTEEEPEVTVDMREPIKLQESTTTKTKATGGKRLDASNVNEIIVSKEPATNDEGELVLNPDEELPPTPVLKLRLGEIDGAPVEEKVKA